MTFDEKLEQMRGELRRFAQTLIAEEADEAAIAALAAVQAIVTLDDKLDHYGLAESDWNTI